MSSVGASPEPHVGVAAAPDTRKKGREGEDAAAEYLLGQGYTIVSRNHQTRAGEIDCIARDPDGVLVFVEVKFSRGGPVHPVFWVTPAKQRQLVRMARAYLAFHQARSACRFDVIAISGGKIDHIRNAFLAG
jgi:putative endonuclease